MKKTSLLVLLSIIFTLFLVGCEDKKATLTAVDVSDLKVPDSFNYETSHQVNVAIQGDYKLPVTITTVEGKVLYRGLLQPANGLAAKLTLPYTVKKVVIIYHVQEVTVNVTTSGIVYNFRSATVGAL